MSDPAHCPGSKKLLCFNGSLIVHTCRQVTKPMQKLILTALVVASMASQAASPGVQVKASAEKPKGGLYPIAVTFSIPDGYHIYGPKVKEGIPTKIAVKGTAFKIASVSYPKTKTFVQLGESFEVYEDVAKVKLVIKPVKPFKGKATVKLNVTTQACNDRTCLPASTQEVLVTIKS